MMHGPTNITFKSCQVHVYKVAYEFQLELWKGFRYIDIDIGIGIDIALHTRHQACLQDITFVFA